MQKDKKTNLVWQTFGHFLREWRINWYYVVPVILLLPIAVICDNFVTTYTFSLVIDRLTAITDFSFAYLTAEFWPLIVVSLGALFLGNMSWRLAIWLFWRLETRVVYGLRRLAFSTLSTQSMSFHHNRFGGSLVSAVSQFTGAYIDFADTLIFQFIDAILSTIIVIVMVTLKFPWYGFFLIGLSSVFLVIATFSYKKLMPLQEKNSYQRRKLSGVLADSLSNILTVKSYGQEKQEQARYAKTNRKSQLATFAVIRAVTWRDTSFSALSVVLNFGLLLTMVFGHTWWGISLGTLFLVSNLTGMLINALWESPHIMRRFNDAFAEASEMTQLLALPAGVTDAPNARALQVPRGQIDFQNLSFSHREDENKLTVFKDFNLNITAGQRVGLVGKSGSGKTTLTKLLLRFADLDQGSIAIDGQNIAAVAQESLRHQIAYVPQESTLFHRTLRENIAYGRPDASEQEIIQAAQLANAWEFITKLPQGLDTLTGERGVKLSGGQRQRVVIARAILKNAPILVLDEATSALDSESEKLIQDALQKLMKNRTCIIIAHRLSTVSNLDRIVVLKDGKIVEDGTHRELCHGSGEYAKLWERQSGAFLD